MVKKPKKYMMPSGYGGLMFLEEEPEAKIKIKAEHIIIISVLIGTLVLLLRILLV
ncbi:MAG: hypothetical protein QXS69_01285 [Candidatus Aenigmatarchaeota archaeon]